ncbi:MAG TPA: CDGSH iron-sulfur domain-containing protein [Burkholderiales bacterium]|nr:CDGSH iron-sulfur domain-containing protein [Burkholderiales bacterium]
MNRIAMTADGPYHCTGALQLKAGDGTAVGAAREVWLCACGASRDKPYCDGSHALVGFANGEGTATATQESLPAVEAPLAIRTRTDGPLKLDGPCEVVSPNGTVLLRGNETALCRCGRSARKPFCDGTHRRIGFVAP